MSVDLEEVQARMQPGAWESEGFLLPGSDLVELLIADAEQVRSRGAEPQDVGARLVKLLQAAGSSDWARPVLVGHHSVEVHRERGLITCPWAPDEFVACPAGRGTRATANRFSIKHKPSRKSLRGFEITAHMIDGHGFFGGPGTKFRIEPEEAIAALGLSH